MAPWPLPLNAPLDSFLCVLIREDVFFVQDEYYKPLGDRDTGGFLTDLLDEIQKKAGITYTIMAKPDLRFDSPNADGSWTGTLVGEVADPSSVSLFSQSINQSINR